jgi:hypothetical protein
MVHPVQNGVGSRTQKRRTLRNVSENIEKLLPELAHGEHLVSGVSVQEESLAEKRYVPVGEEKGEDNHLVIRI